MPYLIREFEKLQLYGLAEIFAFRGDSAAQFAHKLAVFHHRPEFTDVVVIESNIHQITQMLVMRRMRHFYFGHSIPLFPEKNKVL